VSDEIKEMSFLDHLEELRWRIIKCLIALTATAIPCGIFWRQIFDVVMIYPLRFSDPKPKLIYTAPAEAVVLSIKIAIFGGIIAATPVIFYQMWRFIGPGLYKKEKMMVLPIVIVSTLCFLLGVGFSYMMAPYILRFLSQFGAGRMDAMFRTNEYLSFLIKLTLAFGTVFELPVISFVLTRMEILTPRFLIDKTRYAIVLVFIVAALLTPPDIVSQLFLAGPLFILYVISILVSYVAQRKKSV
jgi:sec-independent protein translocase protein TatC